MGLLCAAAAAAPAGNCACMGFCGENLSEVMGDVRSVLPECTLIMPDNRGNFCGKFEQFANKYPAHEKTAEKSALLSSLNLKFSALHPKELLGDVGAALGVLGVPVRADLFGVFRGQHGTAHHDLAVQLRGAQGGDGLLHAFQGGGHQGGKAYQMHVLSRTVSTTVSTGTSRPRSSTSKP